MVWIPERVPARTAISSPMQRTQFPSEQEMVGPALPLRSVPISSLRLLTADFRPDQLPSHCGLCVVPSKFCEVLYNSNFPCAAADSVLASREAISCWFIGLKFRAVFSA